MHVHLVIQYHAQSSVEPILYCFQATLYESAAAHLLTPAFLEWLLPKNNYLIFQKQSYQISIKRDSK